MGTSFTIAIGWVTIWLAQDQKLNRYVAVKMCTADSNPLKFGVLSDLSSNEAQAQA